MVKYFVSFLKTILICFNFLKKINNIYSIMRKRFELLYLKTFDDYNYAYVAQNQI